MRATGINKTKNREGLGVVVWKDGSVYHGYWRNDQPEGFGRMVRLY
jgi:hypothetical protein